MTDVVDSVVKIMIVDDHEMVRRGLRSFLRTFDDLCVVGEAGDGIEALEKCAELNPQVILMDVMMPQSDGVEATRAIRRQFPEVAIIALSSSSEMEIVKAMMQAGAIGYLLKNVSTEQLADAIRNASLGSSMFSPEATKALVAATHKVESHYNLTERERDVLRLMVDGMNNNEISEGLHLGLGTVKNHVSTIMRKLDVNKRAEAIVIAVRKNLV